MALTSGIIQSDDVRARAVADFHPKKVSSEMPSAAKEFIRTQADSNETRFKINPLIADQTGIAEIERLSLEDLVEKRAIEKLKDLQEAAYKEAYALGIDEGRKDAFEQCSAEIQASLEKFNEVTTYVESLKKDLVSANESQIVNLVFHIASQIAFEAIDKNDARVESVLRELVSSIHEDEVFSIRLATKDMAHFQNLIQGKTDEFEFLKTIKIVESPELAPGGCVVETNYGLIDASLEERVKRAWEILASKKPKLKEKFE